MDKKNLKMYVSPSVETIEAELESQLLQASIVQPTWSRESAELDEEEEI